MTSASTTSVLKTDLWEDLWIRDWKLTVRQLPIALRAAWMSLLRVRPLTSSGHYYRSMIRSALATLAHRRLVLPNEFLTTEVVVSYKGAKYLLTRESQFGYYLCFTEPATVAYMSRASGGVFVELGANCGQYSVPASFRFRHVVALEPNPIALGILRRNLELNGIGNVTVLAQAISIQGEPVTLYEGRWLSTWSNQPVLPTGRRVTVEGTTLGRLLRSYGPIDLLKIDVEGAEGGVTGEARSSLADVRRVIIETLSSEVVRTLAEEGFELEFLETLLRPRENILAVRGRAG